MGNRLKNCLTRQEILILKRFPMEFFSSVKSMRNLIYMSSRRFNPHGRRWNITPLPRRVFTTMSNMASSFEKRPGYFPSIQFSPILNQMTCVIRQNVANESNHQNFRSNCALLLETIAIHGFSRRATGLKLGQNPPFCCRSA